MEIGEMIHLVLPVSQHESAKQWFSFKVLREPLRRKRRWWPKQRLPYQYETYRASLTAGSSDGHVNGNGTALHTGLAPGTCSVRHEAFYDDIERWFEEHRV